MKGTTVSHSFPKWWHHHHEVHPQLAQAGSVSENLGALKFTMDDSLYKLCHWLQPVLIDSLSRIWTLTVLYHPNKTGEPKKNTRNWEDLLLGQEQTRGRKTLPRPFYLDMHEATECKPSVTPPVLVASCMSSPTVFPGLSGISHSSPNDPQTPSDPVSLPSTSSTASTSSYEPPSKKSYLTTKGLADYFQKEAEKKEDTSKWPNWDISVLIWKNGGEYVSCFCCECFI